MDAKFSAEVLIDTNRFDDDFAVLTDEAGFVVDAIWPADAPTTALLSGHGLRIRLVATERPAPATILLISDAPDRHSAARQLPGGSRLLFETPPAPVRLPAAVPELTITNSAARPGAAGRAGMQYVDLLPNRWGGRFITSLISIPDGGPVPDYVHFHRVRFQLIFVKSGWVRVVYEDQGEAFVMQAGDAVLQVPEIRHRVLEASPGLEVIEVTSPADHMTFGDHGLDLPNAVGPPDRRWDGQRFVHHRGAEATSEPWDVKGWDARNTSIESATDGLARVRVARPRTTDGAAQGADAPGTDAPGLVGEGEFRQLVVLTGQVTFECDGEQVRLTDGSSIAIPPGAFCAVREPSIDCELLDVIVYPPT